jgi:3-deoxy-D-manno-octulosonic-acid transferase
MYLLYSFLLTLGFFVLLPRFLFDAVRHGKYVAGFRERLGSVPHMPGKHPRIWLHCVSVGETQAARPLVDIIGRQFPNYEIVISTITLTGQRLAREVFKGKATRVIYFPFDWRWSVRRTLKAVNPSIVLLMETELWPNFLRESAAQQIPVVLVNGRLSDKSVRRYRHIANFFRRVVSHLDRAIMQSDRDAERLRELGFPSDKIFVSGNLKFDAGKMSPGEMLTGLLRQRFALKAENLILAASTHAPEERILVESLRIVRQNFTETRMMIAPRHPERFGEVASLLKSSGFSWAKRTDPEAARDKQSDVILLDTIGELPAAYPLAGIVFVGGSIANSGGHNVLEPAAFGCCVITGANTQNFGAIVSDFVDAEAIIQLSNSPAAQIGNQLATVFESLLRNPEQRMELGKRAAQMLERNTGASERTVQLIAPMISGARNQPW